jgi:hypothetical protein
MTMWWILGSVSTYALVFLVLYRMVVRAPDPPKAGRGFTAYERAPDMVNTEVGAMRPAGIIPSTGGHYDDTH